MRILKIYLADDHAMFRRAIVRVLTGMNKGFEITEAINGRHLLSYIREEIPDIVILDLEMPVMNGFKACEIIAREYPEVKIIILSMYDTAEEKERVQRLGAHAFMSKHAEPEALEELILSLADQNVRFHGFGETTMFHCVTPIDGEECGVSMKVELTPREFDIVGLLCKELTNRQIGCQLQLSENTVRNHKVRIMRKAGVKNTPGLVRMVYENRFLIRDPDPGNTVGGIVQA